MNKLKLLRPVKDEFKPTKQYFSALDKLYGAELCPECGGKTFMKLPSLEKKRCYDCGKVIKGV